MTITVVDSNGERFITDFGETILASCDGEQLEIPRYGVWQNDRLGKAEVIFTTNNFVEAQAMMTTSLRVGSKVRRKGNWNSARTAQVVAFVDVDTVRVWPFLGEGHDTWSVFDLELVPQLQEEQR